MDSLPFLLFDYFENYTSGSNQGNTVTIFYNDSDTLGGYYFLPKRN